MFNRVFLNGLRARALRRGVLFSSLDDLERGILYLAGRVVDCVSSSVLSRQLELIVSKLDAAVAGGFIGHVLGYGVKQANKLIEYAESFGSNVACGWLGCPWFSGYLAFLDVNR